MAYIVSQKRDYILNIDSIIGLTILDNEIAAEVEYGKYKYLARYNSPDRARDVFSEMMSAIFPETLVLKDMEISEDIEERLRKMPLSTVCVKTPHNDPDAFKVKNGAYYMPER